MTFAFVKSLILSAKMHICSMKTWKLMSYEINKLILLNNKNKHSYVLMKILLNEVSLYQMQSGVMIISYLYKLLLFFVVFFSPLPPSLPLQD
jgi:hypothetical protein